MSTWDGLRPRVTEEVVSTRAGDGAVPASITLAQTLSPGAHSNRPPEHIFQNLPHLLSLEICLSSYSSLPISDDECSCGGTVVSCLFLTCIEDYHHIMRESHANTRHVGVRFLLSTYHVACESVLCNNMIGGCKGHKLKLRTPYSASLAVLRGLLAAGVG